MSDEEEVYSWVWKLKENISQLNAIFPFTFMFFYFSSPLSFVANPEKKLIVVYVIILLKILAKKKRRKKSLKRKFTSNFNNILNFENPERIIIMPLFTDHLFTDHLFLSGFSKEINLWPCPMSILLYLYICISVNRWFRLWHTTDKLDARFLSYHHMHILFWYKSIYLSSNDKFSQQKL